MKHPVCPGPQRILEKRFYQDLVTIKIRIHFYAIAIMNMMKGLNCWCTRGGSYNGGFQKLHNCDEVGLGVWLSGIVIMIITIIFIIMTTLIMIITLPPG